MVKKLLIHLKFNFWDIWASKIVFSPVVRCKFKLTKSCILWNLYSLVCEIIELHKIFSSIVWIKKCSAICEHQAIFGRKSTPSVELTASSCRNERLDSAFYNFYLSWENWEIFSHLDISTHCFRSFSFWKKCCIIATNENIFHMIKRKNKSDIKIFKWLTFSSLSKYCLNRVKFGENRKSVKW